MVSVNSGYFGELSDDDVALLTPDDGDGVLNIANVMKYDRFMKLFEDFTFDDEDARAYFSYKRCRLLFY